MYYIVSRSVISVISSLTEYILVEEDDEDKSTKITGLSFNVRDIEEENKYYTKRFKTDKFIGQHTLEHVISFQQGQVVFHSDSKDEIDIFLKEKLYILEELSK